MVVNLARNSEQIHAVLKNLGKTDSILDITGCINTALFKTITPADILPEEDIEHLAAKSLADFIGKLSGYRDDFLDVRRFRILDTTAFWLSPLAVKHNSYHWGKDVFWFYELIKRQNDIAKCQLDILIDGHFAYINHFLENLLKKAGVQNYTISCVGNTKKTYLKTLRYIYKSIRSWCKIFFFKHFSKKKGISNTCRNIFITRWIRRGEQAEAYDQDLAGIEEMCKHNKIDYCYIPFFYPADNFSFNWANTDQDFILAGPTLSQIALAIKDQLVYYIRRRRFAKKHTIVIDEISFPVDILLHELDFAYSSFDDHFNYLWLKNYFRRVRCKKNIFFSDEFYTTGRIICAAANKAANDKVRTYGVQHALLLKNHTVYIITDREMASSDNHSNDGLPMPDFFVVWGDYFKKLFLSHNTLNEERIITAGNAKYINVSNKGNFPRSYGRPRKILWCTTLPEYFIEEYRIIEPVLLKSSHLYQLTFRLHPLKHIKESDIERWVDKNIFSKAAFSNNIDIFDDIINHDLIICTNFSSTFFDGLIFNKKTCRIICGAMKADFSDVNIANLYDVRITEDFEKIFKGEDQLPDDHFLTVRNLCYLDSDVWLKILGNTEEFCY